MKFETTGKNCIFGSPNKLVLAACLPVRGVVARLALADQAALPGGPPVTMQVSFYRTIMIQNGELGQIKYIF